MHVAAKSAFKPRVVFYLPAVIPWWFNNIIVPMIRGAMRGGEVHVLVPPLWSCTGIRPEDLAGCEDMDVIWHVLDGEDHPDLRFSKMHPAVVDLVRHIDPDLCLCRSADIVTPSAFPGVVRYIMEGHAEPFGTRHWNVQLCDGLFDHGMMPVLDPSLGRWLESALSQQWEQKAVAFPYMERDEFLTKAAIPSGKLLLALPLDFEHDEVFWDQHFPYSSNVELINALADQLDNDTMLLVTHHPLNAKHLSPEFLAVNRAVRQRLDKVRIVHDLAGPSTATRMMLRHCDGMIFGISKCFTTAAFLGKPMMRISQFETGDWLGISTELAEFITALRSDASRPPAKADALRWFAFHHANNVIDPLDPELDLAQLMDHAAYPVNPARWERGLARYFGDASLVPPMPSDPELVGLCAA